MRALTVDLERGELRPYFLWDEDVSIDELRATLHGPDARARSRLLAKMLREARDLDVWQFVSPREVADALPHIGPRLGRRRPFWEFLIQGFRDVGILDR